MSELLRVGLEKCPDRSSDRPPNFGDKWYVLDCGLSTTNVGTRPELGSELRGSGDCPSDSDAYSEDAVGPKIGCVCTFSVSGRFRPLGDGLIPYVKKKHQYYRF